MQLPSSQLRVVINDAQWTGQLQPHSLPSLQRYEHEELGLVLSGLHRNGSWSLLTIDHFLPFNLPLAQAGHYVFAHSMLPVLGIWLWLQVRELAKVVL